jgi:hypothetical protein
MKSRRQFIQIVPIAGAAALLAACGQKPADAPPPVAAAPSPAAPPPPAPVPAPAPAAEATPPASAPAAAAPASNLPMVDEKDPQAVALSYVADASRVDKAKFAKFEASQNCANCTLYQGAAGSTSGGCTLFPGKQVAAKGWCSGYTKKA